MYLSGLLRVRKLVLPGFVTVLRSPNFVSIRRVGRRDWARIAVSPIRGNSLLRAAYSVDQTLILSISLAAPNGWMVEGLIVSREERIYLVERD